jgi:tripartite ATP-independent transporter DctM subunit
MSLLLLLIFLTVVSIGVPIGFAIAFPTIIAFFQLGGNLEIIISRLFNGIDNFIFVSIPFFILAAELMTDGEITTRIVVFCNTLVGHITGGLAHVNVLGSMLFAGISGSATADAAGLGKIEIDMMTRVGFDRDFSAGITAASAIIGPIIPPSLIMILYAVVAGNVSVIAMFLGGIVPGIVYGVGLMVACYIIARKRQYPRERSRARLSDMVRSLIQTSPALFMPLIIVGGILSGVFTATESAAVSVVYALVVSTLFLRTMSWTKFYGCVVRTAKTTANVMFIIGIATAMGWVITTLRIPQAVSEFLMAYANSPVLFLILCNILLFLIGMVMDQAPALLVMTPILLPHAMRLGLDPLHFGIVLVINLCIGLITPPVGMTLFVTANVARISLGRMYAAILPFVVVGVCIQVLITFVPQLVTCVPRLFGY